MHVPLLHLLKQLRLGGLAESLEVRLAEALGNQLSHAEFLELVLSDELAVRHQRQFERRVKQASFRDRKTLEDFNFSFNASVPKRRIYDLAAGGFLRQGQDVLFLGPPGTGKSHVCQAIGYAAIKAGFTVLYRSIFDVVRDFLHEAAFDGEDKTLTRYLKPDLLIVDDMGMKQLPKRSGECLFEIILRRHEVRSTMMTSNRPLSDWGKLIGDVPAATAILDRFLENAELIQLTGKSYRLRNRTNDNSPAESEDPGQLKTGQSAHGSEDGASAKKNPSGKGKKPGSTAPEPTADPSPEEA
jgi:DNA replication protein DnaC